MDNSKLKITNLIDYLKHPLQLKAERVFGKNNDVSEELEKEYESFTLDNLTMWEVNDLLANEILKKDALDDKCNIDNIVIEEIKKYCALYNILPRSIDDYTKDPIFNVSFNKCVECTSDLFSSFLEIFKEKPTINNILKLDGEVKFSDCVVVLNKSNYLLKIDNNKLFFMELKKMKDKCTIKDFYSLYVISLFYILLKDDNKMYSVNLIKGTSDSGKRMFEMDSKNAKYYLDLLVKATYDPNNYYQFIPINKIETELEALDNYDLDKKSYKNVNQKMLMSYFDILKDASQSEHATWEYFKDASLFNNIKNLGYSSADNFEIEYANALNNYKELIIPLLPKVKDDEAITSTSDNKEKE